MARKKNNNKGRKAVDFNFFLPNKPRRAIWSQGIGRREWLANSSKAQDPVVQRERNAAGWQGPGSICCQLLQDPRKLLPGTQRPLVRPGHRLHFSLHSEEDPGRERAATAGASADRARGAQPWALSPPYLCLPDSRIPCSAFAIFCWHRGPLQVKCSFAILLFFPVYFFLERCDFLEKPQTPSTVKT